MLGRRWRLIRGAWKRAAGAWTEWRRKVDSLDSHPMSHAEEEEKLRARRGLRASDVGRHILFATLGQTPRRWSLMRTQPSPGHGAISRA
eukprot:7741809-Pyramimonas_sp.AAC.1